MKAFSIYRNIMCEAYPNRREELDTYERDLVELATILPGSVFYEYHKAFSARAAAALLHQRSIKVNWAIRDNQLYTTVCSGYKSNSCKLCNHMSHTEDFCPLILNGASRERTNTRRDNNGQGNTSCKETRPTTVGKYFTDNVLIPSEGCDKVIQ